MCWVQTAVQAPRLRVRRVRGGGGGAAMEDTAGVQLLATQLQRLLAEKSRLATDRDLLERHAGDLQERCEGLLLPCLLTQS